MAILGSIVGGIVAVCIAIELGPHLHFFGGVALGAAFSFLGYAVGDTLK